MTGATINQATMTRTVCANTLRVAHGDKRAVVKTSHRSKFDRKAVASRLADIAQSFDAYRAMGEAMAAVHVSKEQVSAFFKSCLDIPFDAKQDDISTRKLNQFKALNEAYKATVMEGTEPLTKWAMLNAVTRYVDHTRSTRGDNDNADAARFYSATFGSGDDMKAKALTLLAA
jgi:phage/plasmid-like protein (TIGR03299 family)